MYLNFKTHLQAIMAILGFDECQFLSINEAAFFYKDFLGDFVDVINRPPLALHYLFPAFPIVGHLPKAVDPNYRRVMDNGTGVEDEDEDEDVDVDEDGDEETVSGTFVDRMCACMDGLVNGLWTRAAGQIQMQIQLQLQMEMPFQ